MNWQELIPFSDWKSAVRVIVGVVVVLLLLKVTGTKKYVS